MCAGASAWSNFCFAPSSQSVPGSPSLSISKIYPLFCAQPNRIARVPESLELLLRLRRGLEYACIARNLLMWPAARSRYSAHWRRLDEFCPIDPPRHA